MPRSTAPVGGAAGMKSSASATLTSPLLFKLVASTEHVHEAVLTMQREVAEKVLSPPGSKQYGVLSVMLQLFASPSSLFDLPPEAFEPAPKVWSSVLRFQPDPTPSGEEAALTQRLGEVVGMAMPRCRAHAVPMPESDVKSG